MIYLDFPQFTFVYPNLPWVTSIHLIYLELPQFTLIYLNLPPFTLIYLNWPFNLNSFTNDFYWLSTEFYWLSNWLLLTLKLTSTDSLLTLIYLNFLGLPQFTLIYLNLYWFAPIYLDLPQFLNFRHFWIWDIFWIWDSSDFDWLCWLATKSLMTH